MLARVGLLMAWAPRVWSSEVAGRIAEVARVLDRRRDCRSIVGGSADKGDVWFACQLRLVGFNWVVF